MTTENDKPTGTPSLLSALSIEQENRQGNGSLDKLIEAFMSGSDHPADAWVRAGMSPQEGMRLIRILVDDQTLTDGFTDMNQFVLTKMWMLRGANDKATKDLKAILKGGIGSILAMGPRGRNNRFEEGSGPNQ